MESLRRSGVEFVIAPGDGAFYGPKIEYTLRDAIGRQWQCGTMQVDFNTAERLGGEYVTESSGRAHPVMLHRAIVGSLERFIGMLIEHHAGAMPAWLLRVYEWRGQSSAKDRPTTLRKLRKRCKIKGLGVQLDLHNEKITCKIRKHSLQKPSASLSWATRKRKLAPSQCARGNQDLGAMSSNRSCNGSFRTLLTSVDLSSKHPTCFCAKYAACPRGPSGFRYFFCSKT